MTGERLMEERGGNNSPRESWKVLVGIYNNMRKENMGQRAYRVEKMEFGGSALDIWSEWDAIEASPFERHFVGDGPDATLTFLNMYVDTTEKYLDQEEHEFSPEAVESLRADIAWCRANGKTDLYYCCY
jgi:hypothetical protein